MNCAVNFSCSKPSEKTKAKFTVKDDAGIEVSFDSNPVRIISLGPNITETIYALGADSVLYGVTEFCDYPPAAKTKVNTGSYLSPDYEKISSLKPDLIFVNVSGVNNPTYQSLKNMGMKLFLSNAKDINGIYKMISDIGIITGKKAAADSLIRTISDELKIRGNTSDADRKALILISLNPLMTTNGKTFISEITEHAGLQNIYSGEMLEYPSVNYEDVISKNPGYIIFPADTFNVQQNETLIKEIREKLGNTDAVRKDHIILIDDDIMFRAGPRVTVALKTLREKLKK